MIRLWVGLLVLGSLAPVYAQSSDQLSIHVDDDRISMAARNVPARYVIESIAAAFDLRLVQHISLDRTITLDVEKKPLRELLGIILKNDSYQLFLAASGDDDTGTTSPVPGTLWIFSEGSSHAPATTVFLEAVLFNGSFREKKEAIRELRRLGTPTAVQVLSLALGDENPKIRASAFEALERIGSDEAMAAVASATLDSDPWVRSKAVTALASGDSETSAQYLALAMDDPDPRVRMSVVEALADVPYGTIPSQLAVTTLYRALRDESPDVRMQAIDSLEEIGGEIAFQALMQAKLDQDADVAEAANESLSSMD